MKNIYDVSDEIASISTTTNFTFPPSRKFTPQKDITTYELATMLPYLIYGNNWYYDNLPPECQRHFTEDKEIEEPITRTVIAPDAPVDFGDEDFVITWSRKKERQPYHCPVCGGKGEKLIEKVRHNALVVVDLVFDTKRIYTCPKCHCLFWEEV